jgi:arylsulfatase A-like enzyme
MDSAVFKLGKHQPTGNLRGGKYSLFDAGTHVPFMVRWPGKINPSESGALVCQVDLFTSLATLVQQNYKARDSDDVLQALLGETEVGRKNLVLEAGRNTLYREGNFVMIPPYKGPAITPWGPNIETGKSTAYQLYDLISDPGQNNNLADKMPDKLNDLIENYEKIVQKEN